MSESDATAAIDICEDGSVLKTITVEGTGETPNEGYSVRCHYIGTLLDGSKFDSSRDRGDAFEFTIGSGVIQGWSDGVATMKKGERAIFEIVADKAYGERGSPPKIPGGATLKFDIELLSFSPPPPNDVSLEKDEGVILTVLKGGSGYKSAKDYAKVVADIKIQLAGDEKWISDDQNVEFVVGQGTVLRGVEEGIQSMKEGETSELVLEAKYAYGADGDADKKVPANAQVVATVTVHSFENEKESWDLESDEERVEAMLARKEVGNGYFKAKDYRSAASRYESSLKLVSESNLETSSKQVKDTVMSLNLNAAACYLKLNKLSDAVDRCNKVLANDGGNIKGLYRRGCAKLDMGEWDDAKADLKQCLVLDATNKGAQAALKRVQTKMAGFAKKQSAMFGGMFDKMAASDAKKEAAKPKPAPTPVAGGTNAFGLKFLEENKDKEGVVTLTSGLQYKVLRKGDGTAHPLAGTSCSCHYEGRTAQSFPDGKTFDSSYARGSPTSFAPNQVIKGWTEAMQLMVQGDKWEMYIPSELGYGERGSGADIKGGDVLVFTMEILEINGPTRDAVDL